MRSPPRTWAATTLLVTAGCAVEETSTIGPEVTDSAGVRVVVNPPPLPERDPTWTLAAEPELAVGVLDGEAEYQLYDVSDATVLSDGTLVVANAGTSELRFYDGSGVHLRSVGREGEGPGEFRYVSFLGSFASDSLLTNDLGQRRASVFDREGAFVRSFRLAENVDLTSLGLAGVLVDGTLVMRQGASYVAGQAPTGADRAPNTVFLGDATGAVTDTLGSFPGSEQFVLSLPEERWMSVRPVTFGRRLFVSIGPRQVAVGSNDAYSVRLFAGSGEPAYVVRQRRDPVPVLPGDLDDFVASQLALVEDPTSRLRFRDMYEMMPRHESYPAFGSIHADRAGNLWIEEYRRHGDGQPVWQVFGPNGVFVARASTPPGFEILEIGEDYVLGLARDDLDVERVRLYRFEKP